MIAKSLLLLAGGILLGAAACGGPQPAARTASKPSPSAVATCRKLPVVHDDPAKPAGFLDVTTGKFTPDPSARLTAVGGDLVETAGSPALVGWPTGWPAYSAAGRWVPAPAAWVSPDGTHYLYPEAEPVHAGGVWLTDVAPGVPSRTGQNGPMPNRLSRIDMQTGRSADWFSQASAYLQVLGFATDGSPLLLANSAAGSRLVRVSAPGQAAETYPVQVFPTSVTDGGGTWLMQPDGTVLNFLPGAPPVRAGKGDPGLKPAAGCAG